MMKNFYLLLLTAGLSVPTMAQKSFELGKPNDDNYRYLDGYKALKEYIDYSKYPNFKLGAGTTVNTYVSNSTYKSMIDNNFTETVAGNAMKMASCVDGNGNMNFTNVKKYVNAAAKGGINVYGHTLAERKYGKLLPIRISSATKPQNGKRMKLSGAIPSVSALQTALLLRPQNRIHGRCSLCLCQISFTPPAKPIP